MPPRTTMSARLDEWTAWAERLQTPLLYYEEDFRAAANAISEETFEELAAFYSKAERENDLEGINQWLVANGGSVPMGREEKGIRNLFELLAHVASAWGRRPFTTQSLNTSKLNPPVPDWSKLPEEMRFLAGPAEQCFKFQYVFLARLLPISLFHAA